MPRPVTLTYIPCQTLNPDIWFPTPADVEVRQAAINLCHGPRTPEHLEAIDASVCDVPDLVRALREVLTLTPRKEKGQLKVLGITGYQGLIELMYRAGAIASVIAEVVYEGDEFSYAPGREDRPQHIIDWDARDRGKLRLAYAYAVMKDGATSKVIVLNRADIERIKASSQGADSQYSPWKTNEAAMWLKSAVRQLAKWVPTSAEYRREQLRAAQDVQAERSHAPSVSFVEQVDLAPGEHIDELTGEVIESPFDEPTLDDPEVA